MAAERGPFSLFVLIYPEDQGLPRWDVLVSAPWEPNDRALGDYLAQRMQHELPIEAIIQIARILPVIPDAGPVLDLIRQYPIEHGQLELPFRQLFGLPIFRACLITAQLTPDLVPAA